jgi:outer membrane protein OmpU
MNKLIKVGCSALCGSLATIASAHAGDMTVSGTADATWISKTADVTGNPLGLNSALTFAGSGELDNGWTFGYTIANLDASAFSSAAVGLTMGGLGTINFNQGDSGNGIAAYDDKMPSAWEEAWGAGLTTGVRLALGGAASMNVTYTTPTILGTTISLLYAPQYGVADTGDKATAANNSFRHNAYDATININPSLGTEILSGLNIFAGGSTIQTQDAGGAANDAYQGVGGVTYSLGPISVGYQVSGDYTGYDSGVGASAEGKNNFYKNFAYGVAFNKRQPICKLWRMGSQKSWLLRHKL